MGIRWLIGAAALLMLLVACGSAAPDGGAAPAGSGSLPASDQAAAPGAPPKRRVDAIIDYVVDGTTGVVTAPATAQAGQPFDITITTFGSGCESAGGADVTVSGSVATIAVWDWTVAGPTVACTAELKRLPRTVGVMFPEPGAATLRVTGLRVGSNGEGQPTTIEQPITVQ